LYEIVKPFFISFGYITLYKDNLPDFPLFQGRFASAAPTVLLAPLVSRKTRQGASQTKQLVQNSGG
jgi:hypothetical protein